MIAGTVGDEAPDLSPIDMAGVARVLEYERKCGRDPREMAHSNAGFDVESYDKRGELVEADRDQVDRQPVVDRRRHAVAPPASAGGRGRRSVLALRRGERPGRRLQDLPHPEPGQQDRLLRIRRWLEGRRGAGRRARRSQGPRPPARRRGLLGQSPGHSPTAG